MTTPAYTPSEFAESAKKYNLPAGEWKVGSVVADDGTVFNPNTISTSDPDEAMRPDLSVQRAGSDQGRTAINSRGRNRRTVWGCEVSSRTTDRWDIAETCPKCDHKDAFKPKKYARRRWWRREGMRWSCWVCNFKQVLPCEDARGPEPVSFSGPITDSDELRRLLDAATSIPDTLPDELFAKGMPVSSKRVRDLIVATAALSKSSRTALASGGGSSNA